MSADRQFGRVPDGHVGDLRTLTSSLRVLDPRRRSALRSLVEHIGGAHEDAQP
jgi:hypothetical protein